MTVGCAVGRIRPEAPANRVNGMIETWTSATADVTGVARDTRIGNVAVDVAVVVGRIAAELHFIEQVEELHPELQLDAFGDIEVLVDGEVGIR